MWTIKPSKRDDIVIVVNTDKNAAPETDYHTADALARSVHKSARLLAKGLTLDLPIRCYCTA